MVLSVFNIPVARPFKAPVTEAQSGRIWFGMKLFYMQVALS